VTSVLLVVQQLRRPVSGGIGTYARGLVLGLSRVGAEEVTLYAGRSPSGPDPLLGLGPPLRCSPLPAPALSRAWRAGVSDVPGGFAVVHATSLDVPPARRSRLAVTVHDLAWRAVPEAFPRRGRRWHDVAFARAMRRADALVVPSATVAESVTAAGASQAAVEVIPHGSDHLPAPDDADAAAVLERLGVTGSFLLCVGTLEPRKNLERLLSAYARARTAMEEPLPLVVVGPAGWGPSATLVERSEAAGGGVVGASAIPFDGVRLAGAVPDATLAALYRSALSLVYVPLLEGFGLPALEAMAAGTPVVASPMPSTGTAALEVDPKDVGSIAEALVEVVADSSLRASLVAAGSAHAAAHTWSSSAASHLRLWERLA
jgi:glycosyltransferase involved in cell wall biosynthesis